MKQALIVSLCLPFILISFAMARPAPKGKSPADYNIEIYNPQANNLPGDLFSAAQADTYWLAEYDFDSGGSCSPQGWSGVDLTAQPGTMFHVDDYRVISGNKSMWCGARVSASEPWCSYAVLPGYGNYWDQTLTSRVFTVSSTGDVVIDYSIRYDSEPGYDYTYFQYNDNTAYSPWTDLEAYTGAGDSTVVNLIVPRKTATSVQVRFWFQSDGAWSDEDGLWNTNGAFILDDISLDDAGGNIDTEDWEEEPIGATMSLDGDWTATHLSGFGDFSGLFSGLGVLQQDKCAKDLTCLWGFFRGSPDDYSCASPTPHPEQKVVPYENALGQFLDNEIWSPWIDLTGGGSVPPGSSATVEFYDYRNRPLSNLIFMVWHVRTRLGLAGCPSTWADRNFVYYGPGPDWIRFIQPVTDLLTPGDDQVQIAIGAVDMCRVWCDRWSGECHSHSPLIDRVKFYRISTTGSRFSVRDIDMFQDNFPEDGTLMGTVRIDAAIDRMPSTSPSIYPGDSIIFNVSEASMGLGVGGDNGRADVYCYVKSNFMGVGLPANWQAPEAGVHAWNAVRYPYMGGGATAGGFYKFQCDSSYQDAAQTNPTPDKFCFDLNDAYFTPRARIDFYFSAVDANANTIYWTPFTGHTLVQAEAEARPDEMQCLPTGEHDVLYVDNFSGRGGRIYWDTTFELMAHDYSYEPDRYDKRGPSSLVGNGLGSRAAFAQITNVYHKILYDCGDLGRGNVGAGIQYSPEKSQDAQLLYNFLDQTTKWNPGLYLCGDDVASEMKSLNTAPYQNLFFFINYNVLSGNHVAKGLPIAPKAIGSTASGYAGSWFQHHGIPDTLVAYGGCPLVNDFDVLQAAGFSVEAMYYETAGNGAVLIQPRTNAQGRTARFVLSGFSYIYIRDDNIMFPFDRLDHLIHIIRSFENGIDDPVGSGDAPLVTSLSQNYPNPFNPATTIEFSLATRARVNLRIYNVAGQLVRTLVDKELDAGVYKNYTWDGLDNRNQPVASSVYFYKLVTKNFKQTRKMVLLK